MGRGIFLKGGREEGRKGGREEGRKGGWGLCVFFFFFRWMDHGFNIPLSSKSSFFSLSLPPPAAELSFEPMPSRKPPPPPPPPPPPAAPPSLWALGCVLGLFPPSLSPRMAFLSMSIVGQLWCELLFTLLGRCAGNGGCGEGVKEVGL